MHLTAVHCNNMCGCLHRGTCNDSHLGILIIKIDRSYTKQAGDTPKKTCIQAGGAVRVIKVHQALTESGP